MGGTHPSRAGRLALHDRRAHRQRSRAATWRGQLGHSRSVRIPGNATGIQRDDRPRGPRVPLPPEIAAHFPDPGWLDVQPSHLRWWRRLVTRGTLQDKVSALVVPALDISDAEIPRLTQLAEREKRRVAWAITAVSVALALVVTTLAVLAWMQAIAARHAAIVRTAESVAESNPTAAALLLLTLPESDPPEGTIAAATRLTRTPLSTVLWGHQLWVSSGAFTPDGGRAVTASGDGTVRVWKADGVGSPMCCPVETCRRLSGLSSVPLGASLCTRMGKAFSRSQESAMHDSGALMAEVRSHRFCADMPAGFAMRSSARTAPGFSRAHPTRPLASGTRTASARRRTCRSRGPLSVRTGH